MARPWRVRGASVARPLSVHGLLVKATEGSPSLKSLCFLQAQAGKGKSSVRPCVRPCVRPSGRTDTRTHARTHRRFAFTSLGLQEA